MHHQPNPRIFLASLLAGPLVVLFAIVAWWADQIPQPIQLHSSEVAGVLTLLPISVIVGTVPALILTGFGSIALIKLGSIFPLVRFPFLWPVIGGFLAWALLRLIGAPPELSFPFIAAAAVCAFICRVRLD